MYASPLLYAPFLTSPLSYISSLLHTFITYYLSFTPGNPDDEIHYFSIVNSLMIVLFLTGVVAMIMLRTLHKDISSYNEMQTLEEAQEESGWKLVHGDVFRPPAYSPMLLSVLAGSGIQILGKCRKHSILS